MENKDRYNYFKVTGAGKIQIQKTPDSRCGEDKGFSFSVEWGKWGYTGGVISDEEALKLAESIFEALNIPKYKSRMKRKLDKINNL